MPVDKYLVINNFQVLVHVIYTIVGTYPQVIHR